MTFLDFNKQEFQEPSDGNVALKAYNKNAASWPRGLGKKYMGWLMLQRTFQTW